MAAPASRHRRYQEPRISAFLEASKPYRPAIARVVFGCSGCIARNSPSLSCVGNTTLGSRHVLLTSSSRSREITVCRYGADGHRCRLHNEGRWLLFRQRPSQKQQEFCGSLNAA